MGGCLLQLGHSVCSRLGATPMAAPVLTYVLNCSQHKPKNKYLPLAERMKNFSWGSIIWLEKSPTRPGHSAAAALSILPSTRVVLSEYPRFYANHNNQE